MLPVILPEDTVDQLFKECAAQEGYQLTIDLAAQEVRTPTGEAFKFEVDPFRKHCLLNGLDDIGLTLQNADAIRAYEENQTGSSLGIPRDKLTFRYILNIVMASCSNSC